MDERIKHHHITGNLPFAAGLRSRPELRSFPECSTGSSERRARQRPEVIAQTAELLPLHKRARGRRRQLCRSQFRGNVPVYAGTHTNVLTRILSDARTDTHRHTRTHTNAEQKHKRRRTHARTCTQRSPVVSF